MTLLETLDQAKHSLFRFEYLQAFSVNSEKELWHTWKKEHRIDDQYMRDWWNYIAAKKEKGIIMQRVSLVRSPISEYKEIELQIFKKTIPYGDDIRIITNEKFDQLGLNIKDFWLIDDATVIDLNYDDKGGWLGFETHQEVVEYLEAKKQILVHSMPLEEYRNYSNF